MSAVTMKVEQHVAVISYNNPPLNVLTMENLAIIADKVREADANDDVRVIVFTMDLQNKVYCAGMDLDEMLACGETEAGMQQYCDDSKSYYEVFETASKPTIYVMDGIVRGGGFELSLFADFRVCGENINLALPELTIGIIPGGGSTYNLPKLIGESQAKEMIMTGRTYKVDEIRELGLMNKIVPSDQVLDTAMELAQAIGRNSGLALKAAKRAINEGRYQAFGPAMQAETEIFVDNFMTHDAREGITAFREKRAPEYQNK